MSWLAQYSVLPLWHKAVNKQIPHLKLRETKHEDTFTEDFILQKSMIFSSNLTAMHSNLEITSEPEGVRACVCV